MLIEKVHCVLGQAACFTSCVGQQDLAVCNGWLGCVVQAYPPSTQVTAAIPTHPLPTSRLCPHSIVIPSLVSPPPHPGSVGARLGHPGSQTVLCILSCHPPSFVSRDERQCSHPFSWLNPILSHGCSTLYVHSPSSGRRGRVGTHADRAVSI